MQFSLLCCCCQADAAAPIALSAVAAATAPAAVVVVDVALSYQASMMRCLEDMARRRHMLCLMFIVRTGKT